MQLWGLESQHHFNYTALERVFFERLVLATGPYTGPYMTHTTRLLSLLLSLMIPGICNAYADPCVPAGATIAEVRALPGLPGSGEVAAFGLIDGVPVVVVDGMAWGQDPTTCQWIFILNMYDPDFFADSFFMQDGQWHRRYENGQTMPLSTEFSDNFNSGSGVTDLLLPDASRYTSFVLLSPMAPTIPDYNALRNCIFAGTCDFLDNRIDFDPKSGRNGSQSLRFYSVSPSEDMITAKSLVERGLFFFRKGDTAWFSGWYKAEETLPFTLLDFEVSGIIYRPGIRLTIRGGALSVELKWLDKPQYLQESGAEILFPVDQWVHVQMRVLFSEDESGEVEVWQNGVRIINQQGRTLPTAESVVDFMQIGITATPRESVLHVDDVQVSARRITPSPPNQPPSTPTRANSASKATSEPVP